MSPTQRCRYSAGCHRSGVRSDTRFLASMARGKVPMCPGELDRSYIRRRSQPRALRCRKPCQKHNGYWAALPAAIPVSNCSHPKARCRCNGWVRLQRLRFLRTGQFHLRLDQKPSREDFARPGTMQVSAASMSIRSRSTYPRGRWCHRSRQKAPHCPLGHDSSPGRAAVKSIRIWGGV